MEFWFAQSCLPCSGNSVDVLTSHDIQNGQLLGEEFPTEAK